MTQTTDRQVYLDWAAATPVDKRVLATMLPYFSERFFNPSASYLPAVQIRHDFDKAKTKIANLIGAKADQLVMTAGATESINLAFSIATNLIYSGIEHPSVQNVAQLKSSVQVAPVTSQGLVDLIRLQQLITDQTDFISICLVSSDLGTIQPLSEIASLIKKVRIERFEAGNLTPLIFHSDASQGMGYLKINPSRLGLDLLTISAATIGGPKQVGALWVRPGLTLKPNIIGGGQENGLRGGTENVAGVMGFAKAAELVAPGISKSVAKQRDHLQAMLVEGLGQLTILGHHKKRLPNYLVVSFENIEAERLIFRLEKLGVYVSTGAACSANAGRGSLALSSLGLTAAVQAGSLRITLGHDMSNDDLEYAGQMIINEVKLEQKRVGMRL